jgi:hypothetical protein
MTETERKELLDEHDAKITPFIEKIRPIADMNNSGFITTEEGSQFRTIVEFGYRASHVLAEEGHDIKKFCAGMSMNEEQVRDLIKQYEKVLVKARVAGLNFPDVDI